MQHRRARLPRRTIRDPESHTMKINRIEPIHIAIPYDHGAPHPVMANGDPWTTMQALYVKVETDSGITGWGEAFGFAGCRVTRAAMDLAVSPLLIGREISDIGALMDDLRYKLRNLGTNGPVGFAISGIDVALWDIAGKAAGKPVHRMLNPAGRRNQIPAYASLLRLEKKQQIEYVCGIALSRGYRHIKLHENSVEAVATARNFIGPDIGLMLDTNCHFTVDEAIEKARAMRPYNLLWFEEPVMPVDDYAAMARVRKEGGIPVAAGENLGNLLEVGRIIEADAVDYVQPDAIKMGGVSECWKALQLARNMGVKAEPHSPFYGPGLIASVHLCAAAEDEILAEFFYADLEANPVGALARPEGGMMSVPQMPGLGIEVDEDMLERYRLRN